jgi:spore coat polysaccharide biosynthesis protein SpsF
MLIATIQARTGSSRYPGKVIEDVAGRPMIVQQYLRVQSSNLFQKILVATTDSHKDNVLCQILDTYNIEYFRGSEPNVLGRLHDGLAEFPDDAIHFEFTGDAPMADPAIMLFLLKEFNYFSATGGKFLTNGREITFPNGTEMCIYKLSTLRLVENLTAFSDVNREDVDKNFYKCLKNKKFVILKLQRNGWRLIYLLKLMNP